MYRPCHIRLWLGARSPNRVSPVRDPRGPFPRYSKVPTTTTSRRRWTTKNVWNIPSQECHPDSCAELTPVSVQASVNEVARFKLHWIKELAPTQSTLPCCPAHLHGFRNREPIISANKFDHPKERVVLLWAPDRSPYQVLKGAFPDALAWHPFPSRTRPHNPFDFGPVLTLRIPVQYCTASFSPGANDHPLNST